MPPPPANGTVRSNLPMYQGRVNKSELIRRVLARNGAFKRKEDVVNKVQKEYGVQTTVADVAQVLWRQGQEKAALPEPVCPKGADSMTGPSLQEVVAKTASTLPPRVVSKPRLTTVTSATQLIKATRELIVEAGSKKALQEFIDLL